MSLNSPDRRGKARRDLEHTEVRCSSRHDYDADHGAGRMIAERPRWAAVFWLYYPCDQACHVKIGERADLIGGGHTFGSEPYLVTIGGDMTISHDDPSGATPLV